MILISFFALFTDIIVSDFTNGSLKSKVVGGGISLISFFMSQLFALLYCPYTLEASKDTFSQQCACISTNKRSKSVKSPFSAFFKQFLKNGCSINQLRLLFNCCHLKIFFGNFCIKLYLFSLNA